MAVLEVHRDELVVSLSPLERLAAVRRQVRVPLAALSSVEIDPAPWCAIRGVRIAGTGIPGVAAYGVRRMTGAAPDFAALHGRGPAVRIELAPGAQFARLLVTVPDPQATVAAIRAGTG
ncbi:MAG: hypothetical protein ACRDMJ_03925 [Solirubrobacteraceae bacterium]